MKTNTLFWIIVVFAGFTSCTRVPGTDQWKIRAAATNYVQQELKAGEKMQWGHIESKLSRSVNNHTCKYAKVTYSIVSVSVKQTDKSLYLLMSEHCDSVLNISEYSDNQFTTTNDSSH